MARAYHALDQRCRDVRHDRLRVGNLRRFRDLPLHLLPQMAAGRPLGRREPALALCWNVAADAQWCSLPHLWFHHRAVADALVADTAPRIARYSARDVAVQARP